MTSYISNILRKISENINDNDYDFELRMYFQAFGNTCTWWEYMYCMGKA